MAQACMGVSLRPRRNRTQTAGGPTPLQTKGRPRPQEAKASATRSACRNMPSPALNRM